MTFGRRLQAWLVSAAIALAPALQATPKVPGLVPALVPALGAPAALGVVLAAATADEAWAQFRGRSSGGYSRPSPRTPSFAPRRAAPRTPSTSGGYRRPSTQPSVPFFGRAAPSPGDQALSRERSGRALEQQRAQQQRAQQATRPPAGQPPPAWGGSGGSSGARTDRRTPSYRPPAASGGNWFAQQGWSAPRYAAAAPRSFGVWDGLFLWFMLDHLTRPGYANFFRNQQNDPGLQQWRQQADQMAQEDPALRRKLAELDARTAEPDGSSGWVEVPPDIPPGVATADATKVRTPSSGGSGLGGTLFSILLLGGAGFLAYSAVRRRRAEEQGGSVMNPLKSAASMLGNAIAPKPYRPSHFRVGMVLNTDLSPFILAAGATKVVPPEGSPEGRMTVAAVGHVGTGAAALVRLHLADRRGLFQLHLDASGTPDECRYFSLFDEVAPADAAEWALWLDPAEGMIGWPEFQTQDGKMYARAWSPGGTRIAPIRMEEEITSAEGTERISLQSMLYAAPTGLAAPAPETEYILVGAVERGGQAWVELRAGIDINPASLELT